MIKWARTGKLEWIGHPVYINSAKVIVWLAWTLIFAYSFAPFEFSLARASTAEHESSRALPLMLHFVAFTAVGAADRFSSRLQDPGTRILPTVLLRGLSLSLLVEAGQLFLPLRHSRGVDILINSLALLLGHLSVPAIGCASMHSVKLSVHRKLQHILVPWVLPLAWGVFWIVLILLPTRLTTLREWDPNYRLFIGNELGGDRPWAGELKYLAIYDRALPARDVERNFGEPAYLREPTSSEPNGGLLVAYDFTRSGEHGVRQFGGLAAPALRLDLPSRALWGIGPSSGLVLDGELLSTARPATPVSAAIASSGAFSVEVWLRPSNLFQNGPARIVGISDGIWKRNFTLGQVGRAFSFRVRNQFNGLNGINIELVTPNSMSGGLVHVVATYAHGVSSIFANGRRLSPTVNLREPSALLGLAYSGPIAGPLVAFLCALSLILVTSFGPHSTAEGTYFFRLLLLGSSLVLASLAGSILCSTLPPEGLLIWLGPALVLSFILQRAESVRGIGSVFNGTTVAFEEKRR